MKKKKEEQATVNNISMTIEEFYRIKQKIDDAYNNTGCDNIYPDRDFENDTISLINKNGNLTVLLNIKYSVVETIEIK